MAFSGRVQRALILLVFLLLPIAFYWPVLGGGQTLLPVDNLFAFQPWRAQAPGLGVATPYNELASDLILENYSWKRLILEAIHSRQIPLWNPYLFAGVPFLAAGQHSAMYPLSLIFYILPLWLAYGVFAAVQVFLAEVFTYLFARSLGLGRAAACLSAITFAFSMFMVVSVVFPMIVAAAVWLPLLLLAIERLARRAEREDRPALMQGVPWVAVGAIAVGMQILAGHMEITLYSLLIAAWYAAGRLTAIAVTQRRGGAARRQIAARGVRFVAWCASTLVIGVGLGAVQLIPFYELARESFRQGSVTYQQVVGWAFPPRQAITFLMPDFFGNPTHHGVLDVFSGQWMPAVRNALGQPITDIAWTRGLPTWKNYVEAGAYVGVLPLLLAIIALLPKGRPKRQRLPEGQQSSVNPLADRRETVSGPGPGARRGHAPIFGALAVVSVLMMFGTPLYALFFYLVPGAQQLHSPFRWVFPYTISVAILAGIGLERLRSGTLPAVKWLWRIAGGAGTAALLVLLLSLMVPRFPLALAERVIATQGLAQRAFADARMFYSYQFRNAALFAGLLALSGLALRLAVRRWRPWPLVAYALVAVDLIVLGAGFAPRADRRLLDDLPPSIQYLQQDLGLFRITTFEPPGTASQPPDKTLNANSAMPYGLSDIQGYDSIIPRRYVEYMSAIEPQGELLYNRIAPLHSMNALDSPLLDLLGVKYVVTTAKIASPRWELAYDGEIFIYRNVGVMPRAFTLPATAAVTVGTQESVSALRDFDPKSYVILEDDISTTPPGQPGQASPAEVTSYGLNEVTVRATVDTNSLLVLADSYFAGWKAYDLRPGQPEQETPILRADGIFRAVKLEPGDHTIRFKYTPLSFKVGLYLSFMAVVVLLFLAAAALWRRYYREDQGAGAVKRVAKNSLVLMALSLVNRGVDMAFAMLMLRVLEPVGAGRYQFAINLIGYFEILTLFGLGTLLTREASKHRGDAPRLLGKTLVLRLLLWLASLPLLGVIVLLYLRSGHVTGDTIAAVGLFALGLMFSALGEAVSSVFYAFEKMEYPASVSSVTTVLRVLLGALALLAGWGYVGLAGVSVVANVVTLAALLFLLRRFYFPARPAFSAVEGGEMLRASAPLMINHLLATIFFRIDVQFLQYYRGDAEVGYYSAAHRWIDALQIIPSYFTLSIFPLMSRYAQDARDSLARAYILSLRLLLLVILPVTAITPFIARPLIVLLGGGAYLPASAIALQLLVLSRPFGFINAVTQYVLIAIDQQRFLTRAFLIGAGVNIVANLLFVPQYGYRAAAIIIAASELALLLPFYYGVRKHLCRVPWVQIAWKPVAASLLSAGTLWLLKPQSLALGLVAAVVVYPAALLALRVHRDEDMGVVLGSVPAQRLRQALAALRAQGGAPSADSEEP